MGGTPVSYEEFLAELEQNISGLEHLTGKSRGVDNKLDILIRLQIEQLKIQRAGLLSDPQFLTGVPPYNVRHFDLTTAKTKSDPQEVKVSGNYLTFYSTGSYSGIEFALDSPTNDWIPVSYFGNPYSYPARFERIYLTWTAQSGKELWIHIGRRAGAAPGAAPAGTQITIEVQETQPSFVYGQTTIGTSAVQLQSDSFSLKLGAIIKANDNNIVDVNIGDADVATSTGFGLGPGEGIVFEIDNINKVYAIASDVGQEVHYLGV